MLKPHQQRRRQAAQAVRVAAQHTQGHGRLGLMDPLFNLRELCKHLLLLEDHLGQPAKRCPDCIRKHLLTVEALADEAVALDPCGIYVRSGCMNAELARRWAEQLMDGYDPNEVACEIRRWRKQMTPLVFDPRGKAATERVAAVHMQRVAHAHTSG